MNAIAGRLLKPCTALLLLAVLLLGCVQTEPPTEPVAIGYAYPQGILDPGFYEKLVEQFNDEHPQVTVELKPNGWEEADVLLIPEWEVRSRWEAAQIISLEAMIEQDPSFDLADFYPETVAHLTVEGETLAIPGGVDLGLMYYNKDLFDAYKVPYPEAGWTWNDFLSAALALRDPAAEVFGYAPWSGDNSGNLDPVTFIYQHGGRLIDDWDAPTRTTFDDPLTIEALEWYARLFLEHDVAPTPKQVRQAFMGIVSVGIVSGKVGMWIDALSSQGGEEVAKWNFRWGVAPLPRETLAATPGWVYGYVISAQTEQPEAAWLWIDFLSRQPTSRLAPPRRSLVESAAYEDLMGDNAAAIEASMQDVMMVPYWTLFTEFGDEMQRFQIAVRQIVAGDATPEEAMAAIQR